VIDLTAVILPPSYFQTPLIKRIADDLIPYFKLQIIQSALSTSDEKGFNVEFNESDFGKIMQTKFKSYSPIARRAVLRQYNRRMYDSDVSPILIKHRIKLTDKRPVMKVALARNGPLAASLKKRAVDMKAVIDSWLDELRQSRPAPEPPAPDWIDQRLQLTLRKVECIDETNPEGGSDEIRMSFIHTNDYGNVGKIPPFFVADFNESDRSKRSKTLNKKIISFRVDNNFTTPKIFSITALMAEVDGGGFATFVKECYDSVRAKVDYAITQALQSVGEVLLGPIGTFVGAIVGVVVCVLIAWIIEAYQDDVFDPVVFAICLTSTDDDFEGSLIKEETLNHRIKGGFYKSHYKIELIR
jgi:tetrahydromethanopterin S-methyltransferase subunit G